MKLSGNLPGVNSSYKNTQSVQAVSLAEFETKTIIFTDHSMAYSVKETRWIKRPFLLVFSGEGNRTERHSN